MTPDKTVLLVHQLLEKDTGLSLSVVAGRMGLHSQIRAARIQKPGLALAGFTKHMHPERVQILGMTEWAYLTELSKEKREEHLGNFFALKPCVVILTRGLEFPLEMLLQAEQASVPLLSTPLMSSVTINRLTKFLEMHLAPLLSIHGALVDVFGVGILLLGKSGIGKSEAALELVLKGHRLISDDIVKVRKILPDHLVGSGFELTKHHMEIRGLGILNIKDLFGISSVRDHKKIELVIELVEWSADDQYDRLGVEDRRYGILDVGLPLLRIPIKSGRDISALIEVAARNQLLKRQGKNSAREFQEKLKKAMDEKTTTQMPLIESE